MLAGEAPLWSFFVLYPNKEPVCRELVVPQSLAELRESLQVFDDQHLLIADRQSASASSGGISGPANFAFVEQVDQLYDGAVLRVTVPRRCIFISLEGSNSIRNKPVAWYPGASAEQIENAILKACGLPLGASVELMDGDGAVVISATIPNESSLIVVPVEGVAVAPAAPVAAAAPVVAAARSNGYLSPSVKRRDSERESRSNITPTVSRSASRGSTSRQNSAVQPKVRSTTPSGVSSLGGSSQAPQGVSTGGSGYERMGSRSPTSGRAASPARDNAVDPAAVPRKVSAPDEHCVHILAGHAGFVLSLCTVGDVLFTGSQDCNIMIWDLNNLQYIGTLPGHRGFVKCMVASLPTKMLCSGSQDRTIKLWSLETFASTKTLLGHTSEVNSLTILESSNALVSGGEDKTIRVWDLSSLTMIACLEQAHLSGVFALGQLEGGLLLSASRDRTMKVWVPSTWQARKTLAPPHYDGVSDLAVGSRSGKFYSASRDRSIRRWDASTYESDLQLTHAHGDWLTSVALSPSEETLFSGSKDCVVKVWDSSLQCKDHLLGHRGPISSLLSIDGHLFSASHDRTVRVWRVDQFEEQ